MRRRFFAEPVGEQRAAVRGAEAAHLARVLRARPGQEYELACRGALYLGRVAVVEPGRVGFELVEALPAPTPGPRLTLAPALFKFDRFEWMLEKATELGVTRVLPVTSRRADPRLAQRAPGRLERWRAIALAAAQQSRRLETPAIEAPQPLAARLDEPGPGCRLLLAETPGHPPIEAGCREAGANDGICLLSGPEGGWSEAEAAAARAAGWRPVSLGPRILRCETAILAALARAAAALEAAPA